MSDPQRENRHLLWQLLAMAAGSFGFGFALVPLYNVLCSVTGYGDQAKLRERVGKKAWEGAHGLEWELPSPPPYHSWTTPPSDAVIARGAEH